MPESLVLPPFERQTRMSRCNASLPCPVLGRCVARTGDWLDARVAQYGAPENRCAVRRGARGIARSSLAARNNLKVTQAVTQELLGVKHESGQLGVDWGPRRCRSGI